MKVIHLIGGGDIGGAKSHVLSLVKELGKHIDVKLISFRPGPFADDARDMGIDVEVVKTGSIVSDIRRVMDIIRSEGFEIIHSHGAKANMISVIIKRFYELPTVTTVHSDYRLDYLQSLLKRMSFGIINTVALRFIDYYIGVSNSFKDMLARRNFDPELIFTVYNGIDFDTELPEYSRKVFLEKYNLGNIKDEDILVGIAARLDPVKGLNVLLNAAKIVVSKHPSVQFLIAGDGKERRSLEKKALSLGISDNVRFLGFVNGIYEFFNCLDINLLTSMSESFPYVILEGARLKKPTISSNVGGISDLIESGKNGFLFNPGDYRKLADHILELIENPALRKEMGEKLYQKALSQFSLKNMCSTQLDIYNKIIERGIVKPNSTARYDVIISGYYGFNNIGDDSMLMAIIDNLRKYKKDIRILVLSKQPVETSTTYNVDAVYRFNLFSILRYMKSSKLFINGGGSLIQDNTSTRSLIYYLSMIWLAKKLGMKVMIYANGIGPLNKESNRKVTKAVINQADVITLREKQSKQEIDSLHITLPRMSITADPAMTIAAAPEDEVDRIMALEGLTPHGRYVGFSVRKWKECLEYEDIIARTADYMIEKYKVQPVFIPMHFPHDLLCSEEIISKMRGKAFIIREKYTGSHTLGIVSRMEMLIGMRLHALIFAACACVPIVGLAYDQKVEGFLQYINQAHNASAGFVKSLEFEKLRHMVDNVWANRALIKEQLRSAIPDLQAKAMTDTKIAIELIEEKENGE
ncbi:MAG: polysaccharide pyruvyl transferase CsaB [Clostridia bacterium]|nr:polysaccharide pyruvyl transferase CsaB [Clostridia bacterium]